VVMAERFLVTIRRGSVEFLNNVRRDYHSDFVRFARAPASSSTRSGTTSSTATSTPRASWASGWSGCRPSSTRAT
jgi:hypothetical protein